MNKRNKDNLSIIKGKFKEDKRNSNVPRMPRGKSKEFEHWWKGILRF